MKLDGFQLAFSFGGDNYSISRQGPITLTDMQARINNCLAAASNVNKAEVDNVTNINEAPSKKAPAKRGRKPKAAVAQPAEAEAPAPAGEADVPVEPATDAVTEEAPAPRRRRRAAAPTATEEAPAEEAPKRKFPRKAKSSPTVSNEHLIKLAGEVAAMFEDGVRVVKSILKEDFGVDTIDQVPDENREALRAVLQDALNE